MGTESLSISKDFTSFNINSLTKLKTSVLFSLFQHPDGIWSAPESLESALTPTFSTLLTTASLPQAPGHLTSETPCRPSCPLALWLKMLYSFPLLSVATCVNSHFSGLHFSYTGWWFWGKMISNIKLCICPYFIKIYMKTWLFRLQGKYSLPQENSVSL